MNEVQVFYEATPNPDSMKFVITAKIADETVHFDEPTLAGRSPLASKIFGFPWAQAIMIGPTFVTVTKQDWVDWDILAEPLSQLIKEHIDANEPILTEASEPMAVNDQINDNDSEVVKQIKTIINRDVRPAVAMDGGDIVFDRFEDGKVYVHMRGACSGCPSSTMTLKQGIEARLKQILPEVEEVVAIQ